MKHPEFLMRFTAAMICWKKKPSRDWFRCFKSNCDFQDKERAGDPKKVWRRGIGGIISWTLVKPEKTDQTTVSKRLKTASTSAAMLNILGSKLLHCIWWDQLGVVYNELRKMTETISGDCYQRQLMRLSWVLKKKRPLYVKRRNIAILQLGNAMPHVAKRLKSYLKTLKWEVLDQPPYLPDIIPSDYHLICSDRLHMAWPSRIFILMKMQKKKK